MNIQTKLRLIQEGYSIEEINESSFNFPLPQWKDENRSIYEKQQLKLKINKLKRQYAHDNNPEIENLIKELEEQYNMISK